MKNSIAYRLMVVGAAACLPLSVAFAAETNSVAPVAVAPQPVAATAPARLPYGVADVVKLSRAQINEDIILNYIRNTGTIYNLGPQEIVYLHSEGVSDRVVNAMLDQRKQVIETAAQPAPLPATPAPTLPYPGPLPAAPTYAEPAPTYAPAPEPQPASSLYVIPYPTTTYAYASDYWPYNYYGPYGYYRGYYGPAVRFGFRFGGHSSYHGGYNGGFRGGYNGGSHGGYSGGSHGGSSGGSHGGSHGGGGGGRR